MGSVRFECGGEEGKGPRKRKEGVFLQSAFSVQAFSEGALGLRAGYTIFTLSGPTFLGAFRIFPFNGYMGACAKKLFNRLHFHDSNLPFPSLTFLS